MVSVQLRNTGNGLWSSMTLPTSVQVAQTLAGAEVVGRDAMRVRLPQLIVSDFLFQARRHSHQRRYPVRLLALDLSDSRKPVCEVGHNRGAKVRAARRRESERNGESEGDCQGFHNLDRYAILRAD